ncbi:MAG: hypothetical protein V3S82_00400 [Dehalococcoidia bacterium]
MTRNAGKAREPAWPRLLSDLPRDEPVPWRVSHRGRRYRGEVIVADFWRAGLGEMEGEVPFRIVFLTRAQRVPRPADPRTVVLLPGRATARSKAAAGEYRSLREERASYGGAPPPEPGPIERRLAKGLFAAESEAFASGRILFRGEGLSLDPARVFGLPDYRSRFDLIAGSILALARDMPLWNRTLDYARCLDEGFGPAAGAEDVIAQEKRLVSRLRGLRSALPGHRSGLYSLWTGLGKTADGAALEALERLTSLSETRNAADFCARAESTFASARALEDALALCGHLQELTPQIPEILGVKNYLNAVELPEAEGEMAVDRLSILEQIDPGALISVPRLWPGLLDRFHWFQGRFRTLYGGFHRRYHEEIASLAPELDRMELEARALGYLNSIPELGVPVDPGLLGEHGRLKGELTHCPPDAKGVPLDEEALCGRCGLRATSPLPRRVVEDFQYRLERALGQQQRRLSRKAVRQVLAQSHQPRIERFIQVVAASDLSSLANVLDDELVGFLRQLLAGR